MNDVIREFADLKSEGDNIFLTGTENDEFIDIAFHVFNCDYISSPVSPKQANTAILIDLMEKFTTGPSVREMLVNWINGLRGKPVPMEREVQALYKAVLEYNGFLGVYFTRSQSELRRVSNNNVNAIRMRDPNTNEVVIVAPIRTYSITGPNDELPTWKKGLLTDQRFIRDIYIKDVNTVHASQVKEVISCVNAMRWRTSSTIKDKGMLK